MKWIRWAEDIYACSYRDVISTGLSISFLCVDGEMCVTNAGVKSSGMFEDACETGGAYGVIGDEATAK